MYTENESWFVCAVVVCYSGRFPAVLVSGVEGEGEGCAPSHEMGRNGLGADAKALDKEMKSFTRF